MIDNNEDRADLGAMAIKRPARATNVYSVEEAATAITDVLAYIAHFCDRAGLDPEETFRSGLQSYEGDFEDGPKAAQEFDGEKVSLEEAGV